MSSNKKVLEVKNLAIDFHTYAGTVKAIRDVSFDLHQGETLAIVGESGSGKTVTTKTIMGLLANNAEVIGGTVELHGKNILKMNDRELQDVRGKNIAEIFQDPMTSLDPTMKIGRQVAEPLMIHQKISKEKAQKRALEMLKLVGIKDAEKRINDYPHQFSGGMRQRIVIAIALICNPEILIADEPTTALDVTIQAQILDLMKELQAKISTSIIFITHDLGVVASMADRVAVMYAGKIVEYGSVDEIFYNPQHTLSHSDVLNSHRPQRNHAWAVGRRLWAGGNRHVDSRSLRELVNDSFFFTYVFLYAYLSPFSGNGVAFGVFLQSQPVFSALRLVYFVGR